MMVSRRIVAEYKVTRDDILNYTIFDDAISMNAYGCLLYTSRCV